MEESVQSSVTKEQVSYSDDSMPEMQKMLKSLWNVWTYDSITVSQYGQSTVKQMKSVICINTVTFSTFLVATFCDKGKSEFQIVL